MTRLALALLLTLTAAPAQRDLEKLVDGLTKVSRTGLGFSGTHDGDEFVPYVGTEDTTTLLMHAKPPTPSPELKRVVEAGLRIVPVLLVHLDDARPTRIPEVRGTLSTRVSSEVSWNRRVDPEGPEGVNADHGWLPRGTGHVITVGDLCFVALGQIVNERYQAARHQPTGLAVINSPTRTPRIAAAVRRRWKGLDEKRHRAKLIRDLTTPDHERRRIGAYRRLALFYPDAVETVVLEELARPTYDVHATWRFCREDLYGDVAGARLRLDRFAKARPADAARDGVKAQLFGDLELREAVEENRRAKRWDDFTTQPRELLISLFGYPETVRSTDRPWLESESRAVFARFIGALVHEENEAIDAAVLKIFRGAGDDDAIALNCMRRLQGRGHDAELVRYCDRRAIDGNPWKERLEKMAAKLRR